MQFPEGAVNCWSAYEVPIWIGRHTRESPGKKYCNVVTDWYRTYASTWAKSAVKEPWGGGTKVSTANEAHRQSPSCALFSHLPSFIRIAFNTLARESCFLIAYDTSRNSENKD